MRKKPSAEAPPEGEFEARVTGLNPRGYLYTWQGKEFPPDQWVTVTAEEAGQLLWMSAWSVRPKENA